MFRQSIFPAAALVLALASPALPATVDYHTELEWDFINSAGSQAGFAQGSDSFGNIDEYAIAPHPSLLATASLSDDQPFFSVAGAIDETTLGYLRSKAQVTLQDFLIPESGQLVSRIQGGTMSMFLEDMSSENFVSLVLTVVVDGVNRLTRSYALEGADGDPITYGFKADSSGWGVGDGMQMILFGEFTDPPVEQDANAYRRNYHVLNNQYVVDLSALGYLPGETVNVEASLELEIFSTGLNRISADLTDPIPIEDTAPVPLPVPATMLIAALCALPLIRGRGAAGREGMRRS
ncbi:hypothetical protein [Frigidibacter sp. ROC022]|uniref:hypothetical protein n=1 Tax=Frigidibacter sp. ROC022 TaxID=2971796 RepID=UPI00215AC9DC|nr:hypothetical protein [Frigidibacter sp. ROC022]MCR8723598.1 hypothetical protein [Frigidibacter sp. ROC022]